MSQICFVIEFISYINDEILFFLNIIFMISFPVIVHYFVSNIVGWWRVGAGFRLTSWTRRNTRRWGRVGGYED